MKRRILFPFIGNRIGGSHICMAEYINHLMKRKRNEEYLVLSHSNDKDFNELFKINSFFYLNISEKKLTKSIKAFLYLPLTLFKMVFFLKKYQIDIVQTSDNRMHFWWGLATKVAGKKWIYHCHNIDLIWTPLKPDYYLFPSQFVLEKQIISKPSEIILNTFENEIWNRDNSSYNFNKFAFVGNYSIRKRLDLFLNLAREIIKIRPQSQFYIFGNLGNHQNSIENLINEENLESNIKLMGFVSDLQQKLRKIDFFIAPSENEPFGRAVVEAMCAGCIILANNSGGHKEIISDGKNGFLINSNQTKEYVEKIIEVIKENYSFLRLFHEESEKTINRFRIDKQVKKLETIYTELLA